MEYWNIGFDGIRSIYNSENYRQNKIRPNSAFIPMIPFFSPIRRLYPPACKPYGLEAEPEATISLFHWRPICRHNP